MFQEQVFARRVCVMSGIVGGLCAAAAMAVVTFDGTIHTGAGFEWDNPRASSIQTNYTQFGDQRLTPGGFPGSELDELYVKIDANFLYLGVTGNLEPNNNAQIILLEVHPTGGEVGQNVLKSEIAPVTTELPCSFNGPPASVQGLGQALLHNDNATPTDPTDDVTSRDGASTGTTLDAGFAPTHAISFDTVDGTLHVTQYGLGDRSTPLGTWDDPSTGPANCGGSGASHEALSYFATRIFRGSSAVNGGSGSLSGGTNPNASQYAYNNTGKVGVTGASTTPPPAAGSALPGDPRSQTTGLEAKISWKDLGYTGPLTGTVTVKISVILASGDGFVSNQTLPGIGAGTSTVSLGFRPNFTTVTGNQFASVTKTTGQFGAPGGSIDGTGIVTDFGTANVVASQDTVTGFGDRNCITATAGSELDELFMRTDGNFLYVAVSGNLEPNANAQLLFLDVQPGGQTTLATEIAPDSTTVTCPNNGPPSAVQGLGQALATNIGTGATERSSDTTTTILDAGFQPETAIALDTSGGTVHVTQYSLSGSSLGTWDDPGTGTGGNCTGAPQETLPYFSTQVFRGQVGVGTNGGVLTAGTNPNASLYAYNNTGAAGVTDTAVTAPGSSTTGDPRTQTTGLEARISLLDLGFAANQLPVSSLNVKAMVMLAGSSGFVSSQTLPGIGAGAGGANLGNRPNFQTITGNQFASATLTSAPFSPSIDGQNLVAEFTTSSLLASQDTVTKFGDAHPTTVTDCDQQLQNGSEIDQILAREQTTTETPAPNNKGLAIGLTGNLEKNGNNLIIFLDTKAGGEGLSPVLDANAGRLTGNAGDKIPLNADYAVLINLSSTTMFVDLIDLQANNSAFIGADDLVNGDGILVNGGNAVPDWRVSLSNGNLLGVTGTNADPQPANAGTATTGFEILIPRTAIGSPPDNSTICAFVVIAGSNGYLSNQFLPPVSAGGKNNFGDGPTDLVAQGYATCLSITLGAQCNNPRFDADGDGDVDMNDYAAFQKCFTGIPPGNPNPTNPVYPPECECFDWGGLAEDNKIDDQDFGAFQFCATRAGVHANPTCDDPPN